jgi:hypothetical protein
MTEKVRELIDEVVWSSDKTRDVIEETNRILNQHVAYMLVMGPTLSYLQEWAREQDSLHEAKVDKLDAVITHMISSKLDFTGVKTLRDHHLRLCLRYLTVKTTVHSWHLWLRNL